MNRITAYYVLSSLGLLSVAAGIARIAASADAALPLPYVLIGVGCGLFGGCLAKIIECNAARNNPEMEKRLRIERQDERNIEIVNLAKAKAFNVMIYAFAALMIAFVLMNVGAITVLLLASAYILVIASYVYYVYRHIQRM